MNKIAAVFACALASLALAGSAAGDIVVGAADDFGKTSADGGLAFLGHMKEVGLTENRVTVGWDAEAPTTIREKAELDRYVANAAANGVRISLVVVPNKPRAITASPQAAGRFASFVALVAATYPQVKDVIVGNEPNQPRFWQPQFNADGSGASCAAYERLLAQTYDAVKEVNPSITVVGVSLSPRGNDDALAASNSSTSPVRCIRDMGIAYRASGRTKPIMDELAFHPYPNSPQDPMLLGYRWPKAGIPNLDRIKQAVWDAFNGTGQPTFPERGVARPAALLPPLKFRLNEVGWQVTIVPGSRPAYHGTENVKTTDEATQAQIYADLIPFLACDQSVKSVLFFGLVDEPDLDRWQAGLVRADLTRRPSFNTVKTTIAGGARRCKRAPVSWRHSTTVSGASVRFSERRRSRLDTSWAFFAGAGEAMTYRAGLFRLPGPRLSAARRAKLSASLESRSARRPLLFASGKAKEYEGRYVRFRAKRLRPGYYAYAIRMRAETNPARTSFFVSKPFAVGLSARQERPKRRSSPKRPAGRAGPRLP